MRISLYTKIIFIAFSLLLLSFAYGFFAIQASRSVAVEAVGNSSLILARQVSKNMERAIESRLSLISVLSIDPTVTDQAILSADRVGSNESPDEYMAGAEADWHAENPLAIELQQNKAAVFLARIAKEVNNREGYLVFPEIFITDSFGALAATTNLTSDYIQSDEEWWLQAWQNGNYVSDVLFDESTQMYAIEVAMRIHDEDGNRLGVIKGVLNLREIITSVSDVHDQYSLIAELPFSVQLMTSDGLEIYGTDSTKFLSQNWDTSFLQRITGSEGYFVSEGTRGRDQIHIFKEVNSLQERYSFPKWYVVLSLDTEDVFVPLKTTYLVVGLGIGLLVLFLIFIVIFFGNSVIKPLGEFRNFAEKISQGNYKARIETTRHDEIGELAEMFNMMLERIQQSYQGLESRVSEKTKEIQENSELLEENNEKMVKTQRAILNVIEDLEAEKKKIEGEKARDEALLASIGEGIIAYDESGQVILVNQIGRDILGLNGETGIGEKAIDIFRIANEDGEIVKDKDHVVTRSLQEKQTIRIDTHFVKRANGKLIPVAITATPVIVGGVVIGGIKVFRDITIEKAVDKAKTEFISVASHQLRTPLSAIRWFLEMLANEEVGKLNEQQHDYVDQIRQSNYRLIKLVNDLLNISRIESERMKLSPKDTDIVKLVRETIKELAPFSEAKNCVIEVKASKKLPKIKIDPDLIRQVLNNLIINAIKYSGKRCDVKVKITDEGDVYRVAVIDKGIGIAKEYHDRIFGKFFRAPEAVLEESEGSGLGLYISRMIIQSSGGDIWFESERGKGSTFNLTLPKKGSEPKEGEVGYSGISTELK